VGIFGKKGKKEDEKRKESQWRNQYIVRALRSGYRSSCSKNSGSLHRDRLLMSLIALHMYFLSLGKQLPWSIIRHYSANADQCCRQPNKHCSGFAESALCLMNLFYSTTGFSLDCNSTSLSDVIEVEGRRNL